MRQPGTQTHTERSKATDTQCFDYNIDVTCNFMGISSTLQFGDKLHF